MGVQGRDSGPSPGDLRREIRSASHDLNNLVYRLMMLSDALQKAIPEPAARDEARDLLADTTRRLAGVVDRLRGLSSSEA